MKQIQELRNYKKSIEKVETKNKSIESALKDYLLNAIKFSIKMKEDGVEERRIERMVFNNFISLEERGWKIKETEIILEYWIKLGKILEIDRFKKKLNYFDSTSNDEERIKKLRVLKYTKKIKEMPSAPLFYRELRKLMDECVDNVIKQLEKSSRIDKMLEVFEKDLDKFYDIEADDYSFQDTEDRESIGEFYAEIMKILGIRYSRGLLTSKL